MCIAVVGWAFRQRLLSFSCFGLSSDAPVFPLPALSCRCHDRSLHQKRKQLAWDHHEIPMCYWLDVFLLYAKGRCAKGILLIGINERDKIQLFSAVQPLKSYQQNMIQCEILSHYFKYAHIDMNTLLQSLEQQSSWQSQELTDKLHSKRALAQQPL